MEKIKAIKLPPDVEYIINSIKSRGFEAYIVGGCVRDSLMGKQPNDWDITTSAKPHEIKKIFRRTIDTGIKHGTVTVVRNGVNYEITTYRTDGEYEDCRHPKNVTFTRNLHEDLLRRDFTVNAIACCPSEGFVDIFGGIDDIENGIIRGVGEPAERFREDALRMLRAVRFSVQLDFEIEEETFKAIAENGALIKKISAERIRVELSKTLLGGHTNRLPALWETGLMGWICPGLQNAFDKTTAANISRLLALSGSAAEAFAVFLRSARREEAISFVKSLKFDTKTLNLIVKLIENAGGEVTCGETEVRRMASRLGAGDCFSFLKAENACGNKNAETAAKVLEKAIERKDPLSVKELAINGGDIMALGLGEGRNVGRVLAELLNSVLSDPSKNRPKTLAEMAREKIKFL